MDLELERAFVSENYSLKLDQHLTAAVIHTISSIIRQLLSAHLKLPTLVSIYCATQLLFVTN